MGNAQRLRRSWRRLANATFLKLYYADRRHQAANVAIGDFGTSPIFVQLSDQQLLASISIMWSLGM